MMAGSEKPLSSACPTVLILSAGTGGGHESVATAITEALAARDTAQG